MSKWSDIADELALKGEGRSQTDIALEVMVEEIKRLTRLEDAVKSNIRTNGENCEEHCRYLTMYYCSLFKQQLDDCIISRCSDCLEIFGGE